MSWRVWFFVTSHDLRTPLLNIQGFSQLLQEACADLQRAAAVPEWDGAMRARSHRDCGRDGAEGAWASSRPVRRR